MAHRRPGVDPQTEPASSDADGNTGDDGSEGEERDDQLVGWPTLVITTLARAVLAVVGSLALWAAVPALFGWHPTTVMTGSMMPRLHVGDIAVSRPLNGRAPTLGSVLLFDDPDQVGRLRLHRFVAVGSDGGLITRGDANPANDSSPIGLPAVRGVGTLRVPYLGSPIVWIRTGHWVKVGLSAAGLLTVIVLAGRSIRRPGDKYRPGGEGDEREVAGGRRVSLRSPRVRTGLAALAVGALVTAVAAPADAAFSSTTTSAASFTALPYFTCAAAVAGSSPYLYYRMDENTLSLTSATDSSGNNRTGTYSAAGRTVQAVRACTRDTGYAMTFNGSTGYLSSPLYNAAPPNVFTLSIWFKTTTAKGGKLIGWGSSQTGASTSYDRHLYLTNAGAVIFGVYPGAVRTITSATGLNDGNWHQAVATLSSAGMVLYIDGTQVATDPATTTGEAAVTSGYWRIDYDNLDNWTSVPTSRFLAGTLDDAAVYLTALNATTVKNLYLAGT